MFHVLSLVGCALLLLGTASYPSFVNGPWKYTLAASLLILKFCCWKQLGAAKCEGRSFASCLGREEQALVCGTQLSLCHCCRCTVSLSPCARLLGSKPQTSVCLALPTRGSAVCGTVCLAQLACPALSALLLRSATLELFILVCLVQHVSMPCQRVREWEWCW